MELKIVVLIYILISTILYFFISQKIGPNIESYFKGRAPELSSQQIYELVDNCDLVFFAGNTSGENVIKFFTGSFFNHVALVLRDVDEDPSSNTYKKNIPFIWECDIGSGYRKGTRVMRLREKLERWRGLKIAGWRKYKSENKPTTLDILKVITKYEKVDMDMSMASWLFSNHPDSLLFKYLSKDDSSFCSEIIAKTLSDLEILELENHPSWYSPESFVSKALKLKNGTYDKIRYFSF